MDTLDDKDDYSGLNINPPDTRLFVCNHCKELNVVHMDDLKKLRGEKSMKRKSVHMEIRQDLAIAFKRFCANFNGYEGGLVALLDSFETTHPAREV